jgi:hypothetical protein
MLRINWSSILNLALLFSLVGCIPLSPDIPKTPTHQATKTPATFTPQPSQIPNPITPAADIPDIFTPTVTSTPVPATSTPKVWTFNRTQGFGDGYVAYVLINDVSQMEKEDILRLLLAQWLEHCKTEEKDPEAAILDYTIDDIQPIKVHGYYTEPIFRAIVSFSVLPVNNPIQNPPFAWYTMVDTIEAPWVHMKMKFGVYTNKDEGPYYWLGFAAAAG